MGNNFVTLNKLLHPYEELFNRVYSEAVKGNPLFKLEAFSKDGKDVELITGPGWTLIKDNTPHHNSFTYSNGIDYFFLSTILNASAIVRFGKEEIRFDNILTSPKALVFLRDISRTINAILESKPITPEDVKK